jgi:hypothetical protein
MDGYVVIGTEINTKSFDAQIDYIEGQLQEIEYKLKQADMGFDVGDTQKLESQYEKLTNQLMTLKQKQKELSQGDLPKIKDIIDDIGKSTTNAIKKVGKWALAIFGIRSAYMAVRNAMNVISQDDQQLKADIEYMKNILAYTLEPIVRKIVDLAKQLMMYIGYISQVLTGKNIFESADKSLKSANKNAKDLKKTMSGFDEMNVASGGGSSSSGVSPSFNLGELTNQEDVTTLQLIIAGLAGIASALLSIKFGLDLIGASSVFLIISGAVLMIQKLIEYFGELDAELINNGTTWNGLADILLGISIIVGGVALAIMSLPVAIGAVVVAIIALLMSLWDDITKLWNKGTEWFKKTINKMTDDADYGLAVIFDIFFNVIDAIFELFNGLFKGIKKIFDGILLLFKGDFKNGFINIGKGIWNVIAGILNTAIGALNAIISPVRALIVAFGKVTGKNWTMDNIKIPKVPYLARGGIVNNPGKGVFMGGYVAGEKGAEAVLPLTDDTLQRLASMIPITVNLTNTMNGRVISRELQKVNSSSDFAFNR